MMMIEPEYFETFPSVVNSNELRAKFPGLIPENTQIILLPSSLGLFYQGTLNVLDFIQENGVIAEVCSSDDDYKELAQYSKSHWIGTFLIGSITIPIMVNLLSGYIYDKLKSSSDDVVVFDVIIENNDSSSTTVRYRGKADKLPEVLQHIKDLQK